MVVYVRKGTATCSALIKILLYVLSLAFHVSASTPPPKFCVKLNCTDACNARVGIGEGIEDGCLDGCEDGCLVGCLDGLDVGELIG